MSRVGAEYVRGDQIQACSRLELDRPLHKLTPLQVRRWRQERAHSADGQVWQRTEVESGVLQSIDLEFAEDALSGAPRNFDDAGLTHEVLTSTQMPSTLRAAAR